MARRGRFGRAYKGVAQNVTSLINAIARQMAADKDRAIQNAWASGGTYQGEPVSDEMFLAHLAENMQGWDKDDPGYDLAKQAYDQADFHISEDKIITRYTQGKINESAVAQFYLRWAKRSDIAKDSDFYRTLQKQAAKFLESAKSRGRAGSSKANVAAYDAYVADVYKRDIELGDGLKNALTQFARDNNLIRQDEDLNKFQLAGENDPGRMEDLLKQAGNDPAFVAWVKGLDPDFDGNITSAYVANALKNAVAGYTLIQQRANADGFTKQAKDAGESAGELALAGANITSWPVAESYQIARDAFDAVYGDPAATDADKAAAAEKLSKVTERLSQSKLITPAQANRLANDTAALRGDTSAGQQTSFYEDYLGRKSSGTEGSAASGENASFSADIERISIMQAEYEANPGAYVYANYKIDSQGRQVFDPSGDGPVGIVPTSTVSAAPGQHSVVPVTTVSNLALMQVVAVQDVVVDSADGKSSTSVGVAMRYNIGKKSVVLYGIERPDGTTDWTPVSPFSADVSESWEKDGLHISMPPMSVDYMAEAAQIDSSIGTEVSAAFANGAIPVKGQKWEIENDSGGNRIKTVVTWQGDHFTYSTNTKGLDAEGKTTGVGTSTPDQRLTPLPDERTITEAVWDKARLAAGPNPAIDFTTPIMAALSLSEAYGDAAVGAWNNPQFQSVLASQQIALAGGDPVKLAQIANEDRKIAQNLSAYGATKEWGMYEYNADKADRRALIGKSTNPEIAAAEATIHWGKSEITVPKWQNPKLADERQAGAPGPSQVGSQGTPIPSPVSVQQSLVSGSFTPSKPAAAQAPSPVPVPAPLPTPAPAPTPTPRAVPLPTSTPTISSQTGFVIPQTAPTPRPRIGGV